MTGYQSLLDEIHGVGCSIDFNKLWAADASNNCCGFAYCTEIADETGRKQAKRGSAIFSGIDKKSEGSFLLLTIEVNTPGDGRVNSKQRAESQQ